MCYAQEFPATVEEWMESNKIVDTEHIYTNGSEMVPIFRMRQWFQHIATIKPKTGHWYHSDDMYEFYICSECGHNTEDYIKYPFCPYCGADMREVSE